MPRNIFFSYIRYKMQSSPLYAMLKLLKTTYPPKLFPDGIASQCKYILFVIS